MDIDSFTITLGLGLLSGFLLGLFSRLALHKVRRLLFRIYATPKHLRSYNPAAFKAAPGAAADGENTLDR